jgi:hypothetical protein
LSINRNTAKNAGDAPIIARSHHRFVMILNAKGCSRFY